MSNSVRASIKSENNESREPHSPFNVQIKIALFVELGDMSNSTHASIKRKKQ
jgi:hypothetical protein